MNKEERNKLARHVAKMKYASGATNLTSVLANDILDDFPSIKNDADVWSEIYAAERVVLGLMLILGDTSGDSLVELQKSAEAVEEEFVDWCEENGLPVTAIIDRDMSFRELAIDENLKSYFRKAVERNSEVTLFSKRLDLFSTIG